jgi:hypothetical protein
MTTICQYAHPSAKKVKSTLLFDGPEVMSDVTARGRLLDFDLGEVLKTDWVEDDFDSKPDGFGGGSVNAVELQLSSSPHTRSISSRSRPSSSNATYIFVLSIAAFSDFP